LPAKALKGASASVGALFAIYSSIMTKKPLKEWSFDQRGFGKTKRARRNITLPAETVAMLRGHKVETMKLRLALGMGNIAHDTWVFSTVEGGLLSPDNFSRDWRRVCLAKKLPLVRFHDLRHTH
jgi:integrase